MRAMDNQEVIYARESTSNIHLGVDTQEELEFARKWLDPYKMKIEENYSIKEYNSLRTNQFSKYFCSIDAVEQLYEAIEFSKTKGNSFAYSSAKAQNIVF